MDILICGYTFRFMKLNNSIHIYILRNFYNNTVIIYHKTLRTYIAIIFSILSCGHLHMCVLIQIYIRYNRFTITTSTLSVTYKLL